MDTYKQVSDKFGVVLDNVISLVHDDGRISFIPNAEQNTAWQTYQAWVAQGNTPDAPE